MRMPDVNILVYAHRQDEANHTLYAEWLKSTVEETFVTRDGDFARFEELGLRWQHLVLDT